jgi:saxitoxin biosynthesis operon SxtJ-like protein
MMTALHEEFSRGHEKTEPTSNRRFGFIVGAIFLIIACLRAFLVDNIDVASGTLGLVGFGLIAAAALVPNALEPVQWAWGRLGLLLHKITNPLLLGLIFVVTIIPTGLIMRMLGKDPMTRRFDRSASYWIKRDASGSTGETLKNPF